MTANESYPEYQVWKSMKQRCFNPNNKAFINYGRRGITVCEEWKNNFLRFLSDMGRRPTDQKYDIDRIDNNGNYEPGNCRWTTRKVNANNTRKNHLVSFDGQTKTMAQWADQTGINYGTLETRLRLGKLGQETKLLNMNLKEVLLSYNGKTQNAAMWAKELGIPYDRIMARIRRGYTIERCLSTSHFRAHLISFEGKTHSAKDWAQELGLKYQTVVSRGHRGNTPAEILSPEALPRRKRPRP